MEILYYVILYLAGGLLSLLFASLRDERVKGDTCLFMVGWPLMISFLLGMYFSFWLIEKNDNLKQGK